MYNTIIDSLCKDKFVSTQAVVTYNTLIYDFGIVGFVGWNGVEKHPQLL
jgi:hypothetical protein